MPEFDPPLSTVFQIGYPSLVEPRAATMIPDQAFDIVQKVNSYWNDAIVPDDAEDWRPWKVLQPGDHGVCHDYAVTKLKALMDMGYPRGALALAWLHDVRDARTDHMVLLANFETLGVNVLDNMVEDIAKISDLINYDWKGREMWGNPQTWVAVSEAKES